MATRTPTLQQRSNYHRDWGNYGASNLLPNAGGAPLPSPNFDKLEVGDTAYVTGTSMRYYCSAVGTPNGGDATWVAIGGASVRDAHRIVVGLQSAGDAVGVSCDFLDVGDGVALQAALTAAGAASPVADVRLRAGVYTVDDMMILPTGVSLFGAGQQRTTIQSSAGGALQCEGDNEVADLGIIGSGTGDGEAGSLRINGPFCNIHNCIIQTLGAGAVVDGIEIISNSNQKLRVHGCLIGTLTGVGITTDPLGGADALDDFEFTNLIFVNGAQAMLIHADGGLISNIQCENIGGGQADVGAIHIQGPPASSTWAGPIISDVTVYGDAPSDTFDHWAVTMLATGADATILAPQISNVQQRLAPNNAEEVHGVLLRCNTAGHIEQAAVNQVRAPNRAVELRTNDANSIIEDVAIDSAKGSDYAVLASNDNVTGNVRSAAINSCHGPIELADTGCTNCIVLGNLSAVTDGGSQSEIAHNIDVGS